MRRGLIVFAGGGVGSSLRAVALTWLNPLDQALPVSVLLINVVGSFLLGVVVAVAEEARLLHSETRLFAAVGILGGFTTFSTFAWGADLLIARGHLAASMIYVVASLIGGCAGVFAGLRAGHVIVSSLPVAAPSKQQLSQRRPPDAMPQQDETPSDLTGRVE